MKKKLRKKSKDEIQKLPPRKRGHAASLNKIYFANGTDKAPEGNLDIDCTEADRLAEKLSEDFEDADHSYNWMDPQ